MGDFDLQVNVIFAPESRNSGEPVFLLDGFSRGRPVLRRKNPRDSGEFGSGDPASHGAGCDLDLRVIPYAFVFSRIAAGHHVQLFILLAEPDRSGDCRAIFPKTDQADIFLAMNRGRNWHGIIVSVDDAVRASPWFWLAVLVLPRAHPLPASVRLC
jgi:hypothetical protein